MAKVTKFEKQTPLHYAAKFGSSEVVKCLINRCNADKEAKDFLNRTPLFLAAEFCNELLIQ
jgi:ankyrin repeat protein